MGRNFCLYVYASTGYSGIRSTLVEGWFETHPIQPAEIRAFVLLFASLGIVYHGSGLPRISEIPRAICPPSLRGGGIRAHVRIEEPPVRLNIYTRRDKTGLERHSRHSIIWNKSSSHSRRSKGIPSIRVEIFEKWYRLYYSCLCFMFQFICRSWISREKRRCILYEKLKGDSVC